MEVISKYFPDLNESQKSAFAKIQDLYAFWNEQINVISRKDMDQFYTHHVLHSLAIAKFISFKKGSKILDIGTGGGFPGIPLAIMFPECEFTLVDSIGKKINVVNQVANALNLKNITGVHQRAEKLSVKVDFIVSRAVTHIDNFLYFTKGKFLHQQKNEIKNGIIYLKGGDLSEELQNIKVYEITDIGSFFGESFFETKKIVYLPRF